MAQEGQNEARHTADGVAGHVVYFTGCTEDEVRALYDALPTSHEYGDKRSVLADGTVLVGREAHDALVARELRLKTRKRVALVTTTATHMGTGTWRQPLKAPMRVHIAFVSTADWQAVGLDAEALFLCLDGNLHGPRIGPYTFNFTAYVASVYEDLCMSLSALRQVALQEGAKLHIKLVPLGVGPTIRTRFGDYLGPTVIPAYLTALQYACNAMISDSWVEAIEFVDHTGGAISPFVSVKRSVKVISNSTRDALDFSGARGRPAIVAPCDAFCRIGGSPTDKNLAATLAMNTTMRTDNVRPSFVNVEQI